MSFIKNFTVFLFAVTACMINAMEKGVDNQSGPRNTPVKGLNTSVSKKKADLYTALEHFENRLWTLAYKDFGQISKNGGIIGSAYMAYMEEKEYVDPAITYEHTPLKFLPETGQELSTQYLNASLAYMTPDREERLKKLSFLILNHNPHAVSLMYKLCQEDKSTYQSLLKTGPFKKVLKKYNSPEDLFKNCVPSNTPLICWNMVEPAYPVYLYKNINSLLVAKQFTQAELSYFATNYIKNPALVMQLAQKLATTNDSRKVKQPFFWAHLAIENGAGNLCGLLGKYFKSEMHQKALMKIQKGKSQENRIFSSDNRNFFEFSSYYISKIQKDDSLKLEEIFKLMQAHASDYEDGLYDKPHKLKSLFFEQKAADYGDPKSQYNEALRFEYGNGIDPNPRKALEYYSLAAEQKKRDAQFNLAILYRDGRGTEPDVEKALHYFSLAEAQGDPQAKIARISLLSSTGKDLVSLKAYADKGDAAAQFKYACILYKEADVFPHSDKTGQSFKESFYYLEKAVAQNFSNAFYSYAFMHYFGRGCLKNLAKAREFYKKAADQEILEAQHNYGVMLSNGEGGEVNIQEAEKYFQKAANRGNIESIIALKKIQQEDILQTTDLKESGYSDENLKIDFPSLPGDSLDSPSDCEGTMAQNSNTRFSDEVDKEILPLQTEQKPLIEVAQFKEVDNSSLLKHNHEINELREKKLAQKKNEKYSRQTLILKKKDYEEIKFPKVKKILTNRKKTSVSQKTLQFVESVFSSGIQKINTFSLQDAHQAFADLGCEVSSKKGENSTLLKFTLENKWVIKFKFHNPHGQGNCLYVKLKPYIKRFLESINKTPETLINHSS